MGRDPIEESGGLNLYGFCRNNSVNSWDYLGMQEAEGKKWDEEETDADGMRWRVYYQDVYDGALAGYVPEEIRREQLTVIMDPFEVKDKKEEPAVFPKPVYDALVAIAPAMDLGADFGQAVLDYYNLPTNLVSNGVKKAVLTFGAKAGRRSGKERATDIPSWAQGKTKSPDENGRDFAKRLLDEKYGEGNYPTGPGSEFNKLKKFGDRG